jgi:hypothetical protein
MNDIDRLQNFIDESVGVELEDWQVDYINTFWSGYVPGAKLSMRFYRRFGHRMVWETDTTLMFLQTLREGSRAHLALRETLRYRTRIAT